MEAVRELGSILGIWAHPDDETYLSGGLMAAAVDHGQPVGCVTATQGGRGTDDPDGWPPERLAQLRRRELLAALELLGVDEHAWLGYADGHCADAPTEPAVTQLAAIIEDFAPDTIVTFGDDGLTGHPDHIAVGRWARRARAAVAPHTRVHCVCKEAGWVERFAELHDQVELFWPGHPIVTPTERIALHLELPDALLDRKVAALRRQASQTVPLIEAFGLDRWREWIRTETFAHLSNDRNDTPTRPPGRHMPAATPPQGRPVTMIAGDGRDRTRLHRSPTMTSPETTTAQPDPDVLETFVDGVLDDIKGHQVTMMTALGDHLGLFDALEDGPATSQELARRTSLHERYVREWLSGMTAAGYVTYEPSDATFRLSPEQAQVLGSGTGPVALAGLFHEFPATYEVFDDVKRAFRDGGGVPINAYGQAWWDGMERFTATWFDNLLLDEWIPATDGIKSALEAGGRVADVGCGRGRALITLLQAYPNITAIGYDVSEAQLKGARRNAEQAGVADRVEFVDHDAAQGIDGPFDLVTIFDVAHDLAEAELDAVFRAVHDALAPDGSFLLLDFKVADRLEDNIGRNQAMFYGWSLFYCMTTALARDGEALGTCGLPESEVRTRCQKAGFSTVDVVPFDDPFNVLYQAKP
ncbi:MAG: PIG-L family deacetylase [Actinomycetota bacterium]|nr:PIG-L family deacetylase [Actinomycetota bacterium]